MYTAATDQVVPVDPNGPCRDVDSSDIELPDGHLDKLYIDDLDAAAYDQVEQKRHRVDLDRHALGGGSSTNGVRELVLGDRTRCQVEGDVAGTEKDDDRGQPKHTSPRAPASRSSHRPKLSKARGASMAHSPVRPFAGVEGL